MAVLWVIVVLGAALFAVGQMNWLTALAVAAAAAGRFAASWPRAAIGVAACAAVGLAVSLWHSFDYGALLAAFAIPLLGGLFAYSAERRNVLIYALKETRAELARMAVAEERLRISRDLHDLLGHSLSLIALKSELAGRMIGSDPQRAAKEIAELEAVVRRSLAEVRQAVTGYRQPSLAAELAAARRMLASAGIDCRVDAPGSYDLPPEVDALLAWTVREGSTNIVRHSSARHAGITVAVTGASASAELTDDGAGPPAGRRAPAADGGIEPAGATGAAGSGLAGLAERAGRLGGTLLAGAGRHGGFRVRVTVPLTTAGPPGQPATAAVIRRCPGHRPGRSRCPRHRPGRRHRPGPGAPVSVRIMIAEDQTMVRQALVALLELEPDITVVAQAASGDEAIAMAGRYQPDVALLDIEMPGLDGIEVARRLTGNGFAGKIVIVTTFGRPGYLAAAMTAGASGFLLKDAPAAELATAIRRVHAGERVVDPGLAAAALAEGASPLTAREAEVLAAARGHGSIADLAGRLHLSQGTVRNHLSAAIQKLGARNRAEAVQIAERKGWL